MKKQNNMDLTIKLERLYEKYKYVMYNEAFSILHNRYDAEDAVQQSFLKLIKYAEKIREEEIGMTYNFFKTVARNMAIDLLKKKMSISKTEDVIELLEYQEDTDGESVMDLVVQKEAINEISRAIEELPDIYKDAILLEKVYGYSRKETMNILNANYETIKKRISRGKAMLLAKLEKRAEESDDP